MSPGLVQTNHTPKAQHSILINPVATLAIPTAITIQSIQTNINHQPMPIPSYKIKVPLRLSELRVQMRIISKFC